MCQEKKEEEDSTALKMQRKTDYSDQKQYRQYKRQQNKKTEKRIGKKNSDKQPQSHPRKPRHG